MPAHLTAFCPFSQMGRHLPASEGGKRKASFPQPALSAVKAFIFIFYLCRRAALFSYIYFSIPVFLRKNGCGSFRFLLALFLFAGPFPLFRRAQRLFMLSAAANKRSLPPAWRQAIFIFSAHAGGSRPGGTGNGPLRQIHSLKAHRRWPR